MLIKLYPCIKTQKSLNSHSTLYHLPVSGGTALSENTMTYFSQSVGEPFPQKWYHDLLFSVCGWTTPSENDTINFFSQSVGGGGTTPSENETMTYFSSTTFTTNNTWLINTSIPQTLIGFFTDGKYMWFYLTKLLTTILLYLFLSKYNKQYYNSGLIQRTIY